jgi:hypothetical protein
MGQPPPMSGLRRLALADLVRFCTNLVLVVYLILVKSCLVMVMGRSYSALYASIVNRRVPGICYE